MNPLLTTRALVALTAAVAVLLTGCNVVPTYTPPEYQAAATTPGANPAPAPEALPGTPTGAPVDPALLSAGVTTQLDEIKVGEKLFIVISDTPPPGLPTHEVTVASDGMINLPFDKTILAGGKRKLQLQQEIRALYVPSYFKQMSVTIRTEDRFFTVGGEVRNPSRQIFIGTMTVLKAIAAVGGYTEFADKRKVDIIRANGQKETIDAVKAQQNPQQFDTPIYPGDQIFVHRRWI